MTLRDRNDNPPQFNPDRYVARIPGDTPIGTTVVRLIAYDPDTNTGDGLTYYISGGNPDGKISVLTISLSELF